MTVNEEKIEKIRCGVDPWHFISKYGTIQDRKLGNIPFEAWPHLEKLCRIVQSNDRIIILKARQVGITWFFAGFALWYALFRENSNVVILSRRDDEAKKFKDRCHYMWNNLPEFLQVRIDKNNDNILTFPEMSSEINALPTTLGSGRSETATIVIMDEWAYQPNAKENYASVLPIVEHGKLIGLSTANGTGGKLPDGSLGNLFADLWQKAKRGDNSFLPIFIPWTVRPGRTQIWLDQQVKDLPSHMAAQEYPVREQEAFTASGACMFDVPTLKEMKLLPGGHFGAGTVYVPPAEGRYSAGIDTAYAGRGGDFSVLQVLDERGQQVANLRSDGPLEQFADEAYKVLAHYKFPYVGIEVQGQGLLVINMLRASAFRDGTVREPYPERRIYKRTENQFGWYTTHQNRESMLGDLEIAIRTGGCVLNSDMTVSECLSFGWNAESRRFEAVIGHDDEVMSLALAFQMLQKLPVEFKPSAPTSYVNFNSRSSDTRGGDEDIDWSDAKNRTFHQIRLDAEARRRELEAEEREREARDAARS